MNIEEFTKLVECCPVCKEKMVVNILDIKEFHSGSPLKLYDQIDCMCSVQKGYQKHFHYESYKIKSGSFESADDLEIYCMSIHLGKYSVCWQKDHTEINVLDCGGTILKTHKIQSMGYDRFLNNKNGIVEKIESLLLLT